MTLLVTDNESDLESAKYFNKSLIFLSLEAIFQVKAIVETRVWKLHDLSNRKLGSS